MASLLYGLAGKLLGELCSPLFQDYVGKPWEFGTKDEFEKLKNTLSSIEAILLDAEDKQRTNYQVRDWLMKIKLVFYDVEDLLQEATTEALKRQVMTKNKRAKEVRIFFSSSNQVKYRLNMGRKIKMIRERMDAIALDCKRFKLTERLEVVPKRREETHSYVSLDKFIGRNEDRKIVTELLLEYDALDNVSVISIVGIGGLGKTTLAQSIYSSDEVVCNFELMMWVCVSNVFDVKLICEKIIESLTKSKCERLQMDVVKDKLKNAIDGKKYLIVLDDVWNECPIEWMKLEELLASGERGSKILITARGELVARAAKSIATHFLKGLSHEESWALFKQVAFKREVVQESPQIVAIGQEVLEICAGVPLCLKTIGSMLGLKEKEADWLNFKRNDLPLIVRDGDGKIVPILKLSYDNLSAPMKRCFVYCAIFPKDYKIEKERLIRMWMAEGLIQLDGSTRSLEEVGEQHSMDLLDRSFFEVGDIYYDGSVHSYKMHDLIHDLAQSLGGDEYYAPGLDVNYIDKSTRHAWICGHKTADLSHAKKLRTLVVTYPCDVLDRHMVNEIMCISKKMRLLDLAYFHIKTVPHCIGELRHLNYLDLTANSFTLLPESICSLYNLQTLKLTSCSNLKELPKGTRNLVSLRHLHTYDCDDLSHMPLGLEELTCLQTLEWFVAGGADGGNCAELGELKSLVNLRGRLEIRNLGGSKDVNCKRDQRFILINLKLIRWLELRWPWTYEVEEEAGLSLLESLKPPSSLETLCIKSYSGKCFPSWMDSVSIGVSLANIVSITLVNCTSWQYLPPFGLLPCLQQLHLYYISGIEYLYECTGEGSDCTPDQLFPSLRVLYLLGMTKLRRLVGPTERSSHGKDIRSRHFPVLEKLIIMQCPLLLVDGGSDDEDGDQFQSLTNLCAVQLCATELETLPAWLQYLPYLQILELVNCHKMVSLPEWMGNLTSLEEINLIYCKSLASIPDCMPSLTTLNRLVIAVCDKLHGRCEDETGEDWHKIAHVPNVEVMKWWIRGLSNYF